MVLVCHYHFASVLLSKLSGIIEKLAKGIGIVKFTKIGIISS